MAQPLLDRAVSFRVSGKGLHAKGHEGSTAHSTRSELTVLWPKQI
jgi:hypothetical protein